MNPAQLRGLTGFRPALTVILGMLVLAADTALAAEPVVTMLADFEDPVVAVAVTEVSHSAIGDARARLVSIPARGKGSLAIEIGATAPDTSVACDLTFREATRFQQADSVATFCWLNEGRIQLAFRVHDAAEQVFETAPQALDTHRRWVRVTAPLDPAGLKSLGGAGPPRYPIEIQGYRLTTPALGQQTFYLDELQVEHQVEAREIIRGDFRFNEPTHLYEPGAAVAAAVVLENRSRSQALDLGVDLAWTRPDGSVLQTQNARVSLPASGNDFRSYQSLDFSQVIREPGLYRLVARARATGWTAPNTFETSVAVTASSRRVSRGRSTFFGIRSNLLREPELDQTLEISVARDIGANLLALEAPWRDLEPKAGTYELTRLTAVLAALTERDIAAMLVLKAPPDGLPAGSARAERIAALLNTLAARFGARLQRFQLEADILDATDLAAQLAAATDVRRRLLTSHPQALLLPPSIPADDPAAPAAVAAHRAADPEAPLIYRTRGGVAAAGAQLAALRDAGVAYRPIDFWLHESRPIFGAGTYSDTEAVLEHYVAAASAGVGGLLWYDLRDDDNEADRPAALRGLVRRDFSPKTTLLGYAGVASLLTGYRYAGAVDETPPEFDSALFIGGTSQIAVLVPEHNRILPAVLAPVVGVPGELAVQDFERRPLNLLRPGARPLVATAPRPLFLTFTMKTADSEVQLRLARPWLRVPALVFCGHETDFTIELDAPAQLQRSYLQLQLPKNAPLQSSFSAAAVKAEAGESVKHVVRLTPKPGSECERADIALKVALEGETLEVPLEVRPLADVRPLPTGVAAPAEAAWRIGAGSAPAGQKATAQLDVHAAWQPEQLHLQLWVEDERVVPRGVDAEGRVTGDQLLVGLAREGVAGHAEARIDPAATQPELQPAHGMDPEGLAGWTCTMQQGSKPNRRAWHIRIPTAALAGRPLEDGDRLLVAARYLDDDADGFPAAPVAWGGGVDGTRSTHDFRWVRLVAQPK